MMRKPLIAMRSTVLLEFRPHADTLSVGADNT